MNSAIERLLSLRVQDVMRREVLSVQSDATMREAADLFEKHEITGAPVVNPTGECVGVLSSSDFVHRELVAATGSEADLAGNQLPKKAFTPSEAIATSLVSTHMTPLVQTVAQDQPILNAARLLCDEHIHRLIVVDEQQRPVGILSSLDLVACMVAAVEE